MFCELTTVNLLLPTPVVLTDKKAVHTHTHRQKGGPRQAGFDLGMAQTRQKASKLNVQICNVADWQQRQKPFASANGEWMEGGRR